MEFVKSERTEGTINAHMHGLLYMKNGGSWKKTLTYKSMQALAKWAFGGKCSLQIGNTQNMNRPIERGENHIKAMAEVCKYVTKMPVGGKDETEEALKQQGFIWEVFAKTKGSPLVTTTGELRKIELEEEFDLNIPQTLEIQDLFNYKKEYSEKIYSANEEYRKVGYADRLKIKGTNDELKNTELKLIEVKKNKNSTIKAINIKRRIKGLNTILERLEDRVLIAQIKVNEKASLSTSCVDRGHFSHKYQEKRIENGAKKADLEILINLCESKNYDGYTETKEDIRIAKENEYMESK